MYVCVWRSSGGEEAEDALCAYRNKFVGMEHVRIKETMSHLLMGGSGGERRPQTHSIYIYTCTSYIYKYDVGM